MPLSRAAGYAPFASGIMLAGLVMVVALVNIKNHRSRAARNYEELL
jgi:hypothetical protein